MNKCYSYNLFALLGLTSFLVSLISLNVRALPQATPPSYKVPYSAVIAFGDQYTDDGSRPFTPRPQGFTPLPKTWIGHFVERVNPGSLTPLFNYAQSEAHLRNSLVRVANPTHDVDEQIQRFISDLGGGKIGVGSGRYLYFLWAGIVDIAEIWEDVCGPKSDGSQGAKDKEDARFVAAQKKIDMQINVVREQVLRLRTDPTIQPKYAGDFVLITSGPYQRTPVARKDSLKWANGDTKLSTEYLELAEVLVHRFNDGLKVMMYELEKNQSPDHLGFLKLYDVVGLWESMEDRGYRTGLKGVDNPCPTCPDSTAYVYDGDKISAKSQKIWGENMVYVIKSFQDV